jgi:hypothetical protein
VWHSHLAGSGVRLVFQRGKVASFQCHATEVYEHDLAGEHQSRGDGTISGGFEGSTTAEVFEAYLEHVLLPERQEGQVVVMDSLPAHKPNIGSGSSSRDEAWSCCSCPATARSTTR